jgi:hypothetical protein
MIFRLKSGRGVHTMYVRGARVDVRPGETVECDKREIGGWLWIFDQLTPDPPEPKPVAGIEIRLRTDGKFDAVSVATGRPINTAGLTAAEADDLAGSVSAGLAGAMEKDAGAGLGDGGGD